MIGTIRMYWLLFLFLCPGCDPERWGPACSNSCPDCQNDGTCDPETGLCICKEGYIGPVCEQQCPKGRFGRDCSQFCDCNTNDLGEVIECDHVTGTCDCPPGLTGPKCSRSKCIWSLNLVHKTFSVNISKIFNH